ncbi:hypothetical protein [Inquilinus sp.]|jgi:hypothetical protein|uniref:hypothetical protein n=1 Tax=Inquilinus sp. TaxID=1932117 RepID=UPI003783AF90
MCGDLEEDESLGARALLDFQQHAAHLLARVQAKGQGDPGDVNAWLDRLFADILARLADDGDAPAIPAGQRLSLAPLVLARLAGLMAAHGMLADDPLRRVIEALMLGYAEPETLFAAQRQHDHHHGHDHDHGHGHHHDHHH